MSDAPMTDMRSEYAKAIIREGRRNPNIVVLGADTTDSLKTAGFGREFPDRFFNVGIAEANMVTVAAGLAASGKVPFVSTYAIFLPGRAVDQIRNNVAYPSPPGRDGLDVKLVVSHGGLSVGPDGGSHQQLEDLAIMRAVPNFCVLVPADTVAVSALTGLMATTYGPFYMRMARPKTRLVHEESQEFDTGRGITLRDGSDCTIAACGMAVSMALEAADILGKEGVSCRVIDLFSIKPVDDAILEKAARQTGRIVTAEEHNIIGGLGSAVAESVSSSYPAPIRRIGVNDSFGESARDTEIGMLFEKHGITPFNMARQARDLCSQ